MAKNNKLRYEIKEVAVGVDLAKDLVLLKAKITPAQEGPSTVVFKLVERHEIKDPLGNVTHLREKDVDEGVDVRLIDVDRLYTALVAVKSGVMEQKGHEHPHIDALIRGEKHRVAAQHHLGLSSAYLERIGVRPGVGAGGLTELIKPLEEAEIRKGWPELRPRLFDFGLLGDLVG